MLDRHGHERAPAWFSRPRVAPLAAALVVTTAIALAACGGSSPTTTPATTGAPNSRSISPDAAAGGSGPNSQVLQADAVRFAKCMRSHGVPNFPDPTSNGQLSIKGTGINIHSPAFQSASNACQSLMPGGGSGQKSDLSAAQGLALAKCIRAHGVSNFPDPNASGAIPPGSVNLNSPQVQRAFKACQSASPSRAPSAP